MEFFVSKYTDKGGRELNEDCIGILTDVFVVADGLGGHMSGEVASRNVVEYIIDNYANIEDIENSIMHNIIRDVNSEVYNLKISDKSYGNMASTVVAAFLKNGRFNYFNVGDSRLYYFRNGKIILQSKDHSVTQACVDLGEIRREDMRFHDDRNKLTKAIGLTEDIKIVNVFNSMELFENDAILMCTDGFWEYVLEKEMEKTLKKSETPQQWLDAMLKKLSKRIKKNNDNLSAIAIFVK